MPPSPSSDAGDFTVPNQVIIPAGPIPSGPACITISTTQDLEVEGDHGFTVTIQQPSHVNVVVGSPSSATVTISDNDGKNCSYVHVYYSKQ